MVNYLSQWYLWILSSLSVHYNERESLIIQSFNPQFNWFHILKRLLFIVVDFSILVTYIEKTNSIWGYLSLYSYWAVSIHLGGTLFLITASLIRLFGYYKYGFYALKIEDSPSKKETQPPRQTKKLVPFPQNKNKDLESTQLNFKNVLLLFDVIGSILLIISILQLTISSVSFWICMKFDWGYGYPTIVSHYVVLFLALFEFFTSIIYMHWWGLVWSLFYAGIYYNFSILVFFVYGYWIYDFQDPKKFSGWILLTIIVIVAQFIVYFALFFLNLLKTKTYIYINQHYFRATLYDEHTQLKTLDDYYHTDLLLWSISIFIIQLVQLMFSTFGSLILGSGVFIYLVITIQSLLFFINLLHSIVTIIASKSMHVDEPHYPLLKGTSTSNQIINDTFYLNIIIFVLNLLKLLACIILFAVFSSEKFVWLFYGIGLFTLMDLYLNFYVYELYEFCFPANKNGDTIASSLNKFQRTKVLNIYKGGFSYLRMNR